jgi:2-methylisocitrate lyase-like PEP mutase family enzyme
MSFRPMMQSLRQQIAAPEIVIAPGVFDAFSAMMVAKAGFSAAYVTGASIAYTRLGRPDIGLVSMNEVAEVIGLIRERIDLPLIVDADTGYGNALNVQRTVRLFERSGANAIQLEDQTLPKRCGHLAGKTLVSTAEMVGKIHAACDARQNDDTMIIARTDAIAVEGFEAALERAEHYRTAGADLLFIEAPQSRQDMITLNQRFAGSLPLMANMVEGGKTPIFPAEDLQSLGYDLVIFPGGLMRALATTAQEYFHSLKQHGTTQPFQNRMLDFEGINELLGTDDILNDGKRYDADAHSA